MTEPDAMLEGSITLRLPADLKEIERLNKVVRQFGDLHEVPSRTLYAVNLALDEVVTNVVRHGFDDPAGQELVARLYCAQRRTHHRGRPTPVGRLQSPGRGAARP